MMVIPSEIKNDPRWKCIAPKHRTNLGKIAQFFSLGAVVEINRRWRWNSPPDRCIITGFRWDLSIQYGALLVDFLTLKSDNPLKPAPYYETLTFTGNRNLKDLENYKIVATL